MKRGILVQLLDIEGVPLEGFLGTVTGFKENGRVFVHWHTGGFNGPNVAWEWGRLKVLT
jgi:hypothetical protein